MEPHRLAFIGCGNMATALIEGLIASGYPTTHITATRRDRTALNHLKNRLNIATTDDNLSAIQHADIIFIGVKPKDYSALLSSIAQSITSSKIVVSLAAGIRIQALEQKLHAFIPIIRLMPNISTAIQKGVSCLLGNAAVNAAIQHDIDVLCQALGKTYWPKDEDQLDILTVLSGSGTALFCYFLQALNQTGSALGIPCDIIKPLLLQTGIGALQLLETTKASESHLIKRVASPGGTTETALKHLEKNHFFDTIQQAVEAGIEKTTQMDSPTS